MTRSAKIAQPNGGAQPVGADAHIRPSKCKNLHNPTVMHKPRRGELRSPADGKTVPAHDQIHFVLRREQARALHLPHRRGDSRIARRICAIYGDLGTDKDVRP